MLKILLPSIGYQIWFDNGSNLVENKLHCFGIASGDLLYVPAGYCCVEKAIADISTCVRVNLNLFTATSATSFLCAMKQVGCLSFG